MEDIVEGKCPNCYGTKLIEHLDELSCVNCGHRIEGHLSQLNPIEDGNNYDFRKQAASQSQSYLQVGNQQLKSEQYGFENGASNDGNMHNKLFSRKRQRQPKLEKSDVNYANYIEGMQLILKKQTESLIANCGVTKHVEGTVFQLWYSYVKLCITEHMDFENIFLFSRFRKRETRMKNVWKTWKEELQQRKQDEPVSFSDDDSFEMMNISNHNESDSDSSNMNLDFNDQYNNNNAVDDGSTNHSSSTNASVAPPKPELMITLAILYVACLHWRETVTVQDLEMWADNGTLPYWFAYDTLMPPSMQYLLKDAKAFFRGSGYFYRQGKSRWYFSKNNKYKKNKKYLAENRKIVVLSNRLSCSLGKKLSKINISSLTLRLSFSIGIPRCIAKISAMAAGILSHSNHWTIVKRNRIKKKSRVSHRRSYMTLVCLLIRSLELFYKKWHTLVLYHIPLETENAVGQFFNKGIPDEIVQKNKISSRITSNSGNNNDVETNQNTIDLRAISLESSSTSITTTTTTSTTRPKRNNNQPTVEQNTFLPQQTSMKIPWTLEETSRLPYCSLLSYLNFCTTQFKPKVRNRNFSTTQNNHQNPYDRFSKHFECNYLFAKTFNAYDMKKVSQSDLEKDKSYYIKKKNKSMYTKRKEKSQNSDYIKKKQTEKIILEKRLNGQKELAKKRLFHHVASFIGEDKNSIEFMYNKISKDDVVLKILFACRSNLYTDI